MKSPHKTWYIELPVAVERSQPNPAASDGNQPYSGRFPAMSISHRVTEALKRLTALAAVSVLALGAGFGQPAHAQGMVAGFVGEAHSSVPGCPWIAWRLARMDNGAVSGFAYYSDASGVSEVSGTMGNTPGELHLANKSIVGKGPTGTVDVVKTPEGKLVAKLTGEGCANMEVALTQLSDLNAYGSHVGSASGGTP